MSLRVIAVGAAVLVAIASLVLGTEILGALVLALPYLLLAWHGGRGAGLVLLVLLASTAWAIHPFGSPEGGANLAFIWLLPAQLLLAVLPRAYEEGRRPGPGSPDVRP